jgi:hypothetical protein
MHPDGKSAVAVASQPRARTTPETCLLSLDLRAFSARKLYCLDSGEQLAELVVSPKAKWAALSTKRRGEGRGLEWRLRVVSLPSGKVARDEPDVPGLAIRAISDSGLLVQSGALGAVIHDVPAKKWRELDHPIDLGHRGLFRNDRELVYVSGGSVAVLDVSKD